MQKNSNNEIFGAVKIMDGLIIGDQYAANDEDFITNNKIDVIINCCGKQFSNQFMKTVKYVTFNFSDSDSQVILDDNNETLNTVTKIIERTIHEGKSIMIHSIKGHNRATCLVLAYIMKKFSWSLNKALELLHLKKPNVEIRANFLNQLVQLQNKILRYGSSSRFNQWEPMNHVSLEDKDTYYETIINNTYINTLKQVCGDTYKPKLNNKKQVSWRDKNTNKKTQLVTKQIPSFEDIFEKKKIQTPKIQEQDFKQLAIQSAKKQNEAFKLILNKPINILQLKQQNPNQILDNSQREFQESSKIVKDSNDQLQIFQERQQKIKLLTSFPQPPSWQSLQKKLIRSQSYKKVEQEKNDQESFKRNDSQRNLRKSSLDDQQQQFKINDSQRNLRKSSLDDQQQQFKINDFSSYKKSSQTNEQVKIPFYDLKRKVDSKNYGFINIFDNFKLPSAKAQSLQLQISDKKQNVIRSAFQLPTNKDSKQKPIKAQLFKKDTNFFTTKDTNEQQRPGSAQVKTTNFNFKYKFQIQDQINIKFDKPKRNFSPAVYSSIQKVRNSSNQNLI